MTIQTPTGFEDFEDFDWLWIDDIPVMEEDPEPEETEGEDVQIHPDYLPLIKLRFSGDDNERPS